MPNIKAIIADVDGVMVGKKHDVNFPLPHEEVIDALRKTSAAGIAVVLCTAKFNFAIKQIALKANLDNPHITDGGALTINFLNNQVLQEHVIAKSIVDEYVQLCLNDAIYLELYTADSYYVQANQVNAFTVKRNRLLQMKPIIVESLESVTEKSDIIKMIIFVETKSEIARANKILKNFGDRIAFFWSSHPYLQPMRPGVLTDQGVSKAQAATDVVKSLGLTFQDVLGIGDTKSDWNFMSLCGYVGTVGDEDQALQALARTKRRGRYYIASSVDNHGLLEIFRYFNLI